MTTADYDGSLGLELTSSQWLQNHFLAKMPRRVQQIARLPIRAGDKVLDVCCGPGHYTEYFAQMVGTSGSVYAIDEDPTLIEAAESRRPHLLVGDRIKYARWDVARDDIPSAVASERYDVVVFFNCLTYFDDPVKKIKLYASLLRAGGRIVLKDSDMGHILVAPFDDQLRHRVIEAAQASPPLSFDNFFGRFLPSVAAKVSDATVEVQIWSYPMYAPLSEAEKTYASTNLMTLMQQGTNLLSAEDVMRWTKSFSSTEPDALIHQANFFFLMHEIVTISTLA